MSINNKSRMSDQTNLESKLYKLLNKKEYHYNHCHNLSSHDISKSYHDNVNVYIYLNKKLKEPILYQDKKKAVEIEKKLLFNSHANRLIKLNEVVINNISDHCLSCSYVICYYETTTPETTELLKKLTIKDVDMEALIKDLNKSGINTNDLLQEMQKSNCDINHMTSYLDQQKISIMSMMTVLYRNGATIPHLIQNDFIHDMIRQSPNYKWFLNGLSNNIPKGEPLDPKVYEFADQIQERLVRKIHVSVVYKIKRNEFYVMDIKWVHL